MSFQISMNFFILWSFHGNDEAAMDVAMNLHKRHKNTIQACKYLIYYISCHIKAFAWGTEQNLGHYLVNIVAFIFKTDVM